MSVDQNLKSTADLIVRPGSRNNRGTGGGARRANRCTRRIRHLDPINRLSISQSDRSGLTGREKIVSPAALAEPAAGPVAEWLCRGLQILVRRFDSGPGLHLLPITQTAYAGTAQNRKRRPQGDRHRSRQQAISGESRLQANRRRPAANAAPSTPKPNRPSVAASGIGSGSATLMTILSKTTPLPETPPSEPN